MAMVKCPVCPQKFQTHHGLGGHLSGPCGPQVKAKKNGATPKLKESASEGSETPFTALATYTVERVSPADGILGVHEGPFSVEDLGHKYGQGAYKVTKCDPVIKSQVTFNQRIGASYGPPKTPGGRVVIDFGEKMEAELRTEEREKELAAIPGKLVISMMELAAAHRAKAEEYEKMANRIGAFA